MNYDEKFRTRNFKLLMYPDNDTHLNVMDALSQSLGDLYTNNRPEVLGIKHEIISDDGLPLIAGPGKTHYHYAVCFQNPVFYHAFVKKLGLVTDLGEADTQFVRPLEKRVSDFLLYLLHVKYPEKEQYSVDQLFGSERLRADAVRSLIRFQRSEVDYPDAVTACLDFFDSLENKDKIITYSAFGRWVCRSPFFRASSSPIVRQALEEHNQVVRNRINSRYIEEIQSGIAYLSERSGVNVEKWNGEKF